MHTTNEGERNWGWLRWAGWCGAVALLATPAAVLIGTVGLLALLLIWSNLAVGYIGDGDAAINGVFLIIPILALLATIIARGRAGAMMWIMSGAAMAHGAAGIIGFPQDTRTGPITIVFIGLWLASAALFRNAARDRA